MYSRVTHNSINAIKIQKAKNDGYLAIGNENPFVMTRNIYIYVYVRMCVCARACAYIEESNGRENNKHLNSSYIIYI